MTTLIEARFAGGHITAATIERKESRSAFVLLDFPSYSVELFAHEARILANALIEHARIAEEYARAQRPVSDLEAQYEREQIDAPVSGDDLARLRDALDEGRA